MGRAVVTFVKNEGVSSYTVEDNIPHLLFTLARARDKRPDGFLGFVDVTGCPRTLRVSQILQVEEMS